MFAQPFLVDEPSSLISPDLLPPDPLPTPVPDRYEYRTLHTRDSTGKRYMGRDIARYMDHSGAAWLERANRELEEQPSALINALGLRPTDVVADIGAGTGYFSLRISPFVPQGRVIAVDIQPEMLDMLNFFKAASGAENVETILGQPDNPNLPVGEVDLALLVDAYHEFEYPYEMMEAIAKALKPGGRVVMVEYRGENWLLPIKPLHKMTQKQVKREMAAVGLHWDETLDFLPEQHVLIFSKPSDMADG
ncbi:class I SAM-dependent methyltransferase [Leptolyngbya sp. FACHB-16]|nr:class I SAM-dependent methyltransferase [Leptolyngbya sp. FACHB-8]MBD2156607.1 class I SAM-dependent methyltransferase [Leptolyngbya sp. FACHB-16]